MLHCFNVKYVVHMMSCMKSGIITRWRKIISNRCSIRYYMLFQPLVCIFLSPLIPMWNNKHISTSTYADFNLHHKRISSIMWLFMKEWGTFSSASFSPHQNMSDVTLLTEYGLFIKRHLTSISCLQILHSAANLLLVASHTVYRSQLNTHYWLGCTELKAPCWNLFRIILLDIFHPVAKNIYLWRWVALTILLRGAVTESINHLLLC